MKTVRKTWGHEDWLVYNDKYCLKKLYINIEQSTSLKSHTLKKKTLFLEEGLVDLLINEERILLEKGYAYTIDPEDVYSLIAYKDSILLEVSSIDVEDVMVRI